MSGYLLSILGVVILGVLVDIVLPSGQMNKYIKSMFGIFTIIVILLPLPNLINSKYDFSSLFYDSTSIQIDSDYLKVTNDKIVNQIEKNIIKNCEKYGYMNVQCEIESNLEDYKLVIKKVNVDLKNLVITQNQAHINKYTEIEQAIKEVADVEKEQIIFNE